MIMFDTLAEAKDLIEDLYSAEAAAKGYAYARRHVCPDADAFFCLAMSRILYSDAQLAEGALYSPDR